jgi:maltokinase
MTARPAAGASADLARRLAPGHVSGGQERPITVDQTNVSVVVDEAVIVKWFVPPVPHPNPGIALLEHLQLVGFADMPRFFAAEVLDGSVVATVSELVPHAMDGWDWFVDELTGWIDGTVDRGEVLASARSIGEVGARLHAALATPSPVLPRPIDCIDASSELRRCGALLTEASAVTGGEAAAVLAERVPRIRAVFDAVDVSVPTPACRIHGDLHVGQLLRSPARLVVTDFDGNPLVEPTERHAMRPVAVDVASLVQSVDHAGRVAQRRRPEPSAPLEELIRAAVDAALGTYRAELDRAGHRDLLDEALVWPLRVAQELHELVYAARHLPRWAYAPTATLRTMFPVAGP